MSKIVQLFALTSLAIFATTFSATPANALATGAHHLNRQAPHNVVARRHKRGDASTKRCKPRPSTSSFAPTSSSVISTSAAAPTTTSKAAQPSSSKAAQTSSSQVAQPSSSKSSAPVSSSVAHTSSSSAPPTTTTTTSSGGSDGSRKVGLAWPNGPTTDLQYYNTDAVGWIYSWSPYTPDPNNKYPNMKFMAQLWGWDQVSDFESVVKAGYANFILGPNEPNESGQSNMSPEDGASIWKQHIEPKRALGYQTCSPATSSNPNGLTWVKNWVNACDGGCTFDYVCIHWYDVKAADFKTYANLWHDTFGKDIFITEFAPQNFNGGAQPSTGDIWAFYQEVMPWIKETSWIKGAFPFGFMHDMSNVNVADQLMASNGQPTDLGYYIINGNY